MESTICYYLAWEWLNFAVEFTATAWVRLARWPLAVLAANLATHPAFTYLCGIYGDDRTFLVMAESAIFIVEALILTAIYRKIRIWKAFALSFLMNGTSLATGLALQLAYGT